MIKLTPAQPESLNMNELLQQQKALDANSFQKSNSNQSAFSVKLKAPSYYFKITSSEIPRLPVLSVRRLIARCVIAA